MRQKEKEIEERARWVLAVQDANAMCECNNLRDWSELLMWGQKPYNEMDRSGICEALELESTATIEEIEEAVQELEEEYEIRN